MTKAKTKTARLFAAISPRGKLEPDGISNTREAAWENAAAVQPVDKDSLRQIGWSVVPATLTWTPPAKAKKWSAKR